MFILSSLHYDYLSLALFTSTHATNYYHIAAEFLEWWELSSEAKKIFERFYYTNSSLNSKPNEWTICYIRLFAGHRVRRKSHNKSIKHLISSIYSFLRSSKL